MAFLGTLFVVVAWLWTQYLPGYFLSRALVPDARGLERHGLTLVCAFSVVPLALFLLSVASSIPMDHTLIWLVSSSVNIGGAVLVVRGPWCQLDIGLRETGLLALAVVGCGLFLLYGLRSLDGGDVFSTVHHCLYVIVMHTIANDPSVSVPLYDGIGGDVIHYLVHHPTNEFNGLAPLFFEQRLGNAAILAPSVALFGSAGWYVTTIAGSVLTGLCTYLASRQLGARPWTAGLAAVLFVYGSHIFLAYFVNENLYALAMVSFLFWAVVRGEWTPGWLILTGIVCGHLVGVRYPACLFWPAVATAVLWQPGIAWSTRWKQFALGASLAILVLIPWLYVNAIMLGDAISHPKILAEHANPEGGGFGRVLEQSFLGFDFTFRALNWPIADQWVRTAWNPFPALLWLPLWTTLCFGQLAMACAMVGGGWLIRTREHRRWLVLLLLFALPHSLAIGLVESMDWEQITYATAGLAPLGVLFALGFERLADTATRKRALIATLTTALLLAGSIRALRSLELPADMRPLPDNWTGGSAMDSGTRDVAERLTSFSPLPRLPVFRGAFARSMWGAFAHVLAGRNLPTAAERPVYPSGQLAILAGYNAGEANYYDFVLEGQDSREVDTPVRSSLGLHLVSVRLAAARVRVQVVRLDGIYRVNLIPVESAADLRDFSFWLHPWSPPLQRIDVMFEGDALPKLRTLSYGGEMEDGEQRFVVTNYPSEILEMVDLPYTVDTQGHPMRCGLFVFTYGVDPTRIETLVLSGGHDQIWKGTASGVLRVPKKLLADRVVLFNDPYCSDHVPQYGDRFAVLEGPFSAEEPLHFVVDRLW